MSASPPRAETTTRVGVATPSAAVLNAVRLTGSTRRSAQANCWERIASPATSSRSPGPGRIIAARPRTTSNQPAACALNRLAVSAPRTLTSERLRASSREGGTATGVTQPAVGDNPQGDHCHEEEEVQPVVRGVERHEVGVAVPLHEHAVEPHHSIDDSAHDEVERGRSRAGGHREPDDAVGDVDEVVQDGHLEDPQELRLAHVSRETEVVVVGGDPRDESQDPHDEEDDPEGAGHEPDES